MRKFIRKVLIVTVLFFASYACCYLLWHLFTPVVIVAVHHTKYTSDILVKNFPLTSRGKLQWWQLNKVILKEYGVPKTNPSGGFSVSVWDFGDGYKEYTEKYSRFFSAPELYCFDNMKVKANCINKKRLMWIQDNYQGTVKFSTFPGDYYQKTNGEIVATKRK